MNNLCDKALLSAFIFESDARVFTFSMHQQHNYPMWKPRGSLDIGLANGTADAEYLHALEQLFKLEGEEGGEVGDGKQE